jgi:hypothetical protein
MLFISSILAEPQFITKVNAEILGPINLAFYSGEGIKILSPLNMTYNSSSILLSFSGEAYCSFEIEIGDVGYSLDNGEIKKVTNIAIGSQVPIPAINIITTRVTYTGGVFLSNLSDGTHIITVYRGYQNQRRERYDVFAYSNATFTVDTTPPNISFLSPQNKVYGTASVTLNVTLNEEASQISYVLDGEENHLPTESNSTLIGTTLTGLSNGEHNLTVYATDLAGNTGASETVYFTVKVPDPFPTLPIALAIIAVVVVSVVATGLLVYTKKRQRGKSS